MLPPPESKSRHSKPLRPPPDDQQQQQVTENNTSKTSIPPTPPPSASSLNNSTNNDWMNSEQAPASASTIDESSFGEDVSFFCKNKLLPLKSPHGAQNLYKFLTFQNGGFCHNLNRLKFEKNNGFDIFFNRFNRLFRL